MTSSLQSPPLGGGTAKRMRTRTDIYIPGVTAPTYVQKLAEQVPMLVAIVGAVFVLLATLFPLDFSFGQPVQKFEWDITRHSMAAKAYDISTNIILFIPLGLGVAARVLRGGFRRRNIAAIVATIIGLALSLTVELLQLYLPERDPSLIDLITNTTGALIGGLLVRWRGEWAMQRLPKPMSDEFERPSARLFGTLLAIAIVWPLVLAAAYVGSLSLDDWDPTARLAVGNEISEPREWDGTVTEVHFASRALDRDQVARLFSGEPIAQVAGEHLLASYLLHGDRDYPDTTGQQPTLHWIHEERSVTEDGTPLFTHARNVATTQPAHELNRTIKDADAFTLVTTIATADQFQGNDARIVTYSRSPVSRNVTLTQNEMDLAIRIRNGITGENGRTPQLLIPGFFATSDLQRLVLTYDMGRVRAYVDGVERAYSIDFTPEASVVWAAFPRPTWALRMNDAPTHLHAWILYALAFVPVGVLTAVQTTLVRRERRPWLFAGCLLLPPAALQLAFAHGYGHPIDWIDLAATTALCVAVGTYTLLRLKYWRRVVVSERY